MPEAVAAEHRLREPTHGDHPAASREGGEKRSARSDLSRSRAPVRLRIARAMRMRRHDVPEDRPLRYPELAERPPDDRRRRLGRPGSGELPLGGERDPGQTGAAVSGRLSDEEDVRLAALLEVGGEACAE